MRDATLAVFKGRCGHQWIGHVSGSYTCPVCGAADGDHHLASMEELPVQVESWGAWEELAKEEQKRVPA
jgi:hypothetical protein